MYGDNVAVVEPHGLDTIRPDERHGRPLDLFGLWYGANSETANFAVGIIVVSLYGTSLAGAIFGLAIGGILGYAVVALVSLDGPRFGLPQMMISQRAFGRSGNVFPALLAFLAGVGWFSVDCIFAAQAMGALFHIPYLLALGIMVVLAIVVAVYGYNAIHVFERTAAFAVVAGFAALAFFVLPHANWGAPFDSRAPLAAGGEIGGIIFSAAIAFAYSVGWAPCASDYARYLPANSSPRAVALWAFGGGFIASLTLEILGAAAATAVRGPALANGTPAETVTLLAGANGGLLLLGLVTVLVGTLNGNVMNLYSGALSLLVAYDARRLPGKLVRWQAAVGVGIVGGILAVAGHDPDATASIYGSFLGLLSAWAAPWAAIMIAKRGATAEPWGRTALAAWIVAIAAGLPFWQQSWFTGPVAAAYPQLGDLSYFVSFAVAYTIVIAFRKNGERVQAAA